MRMDPAGTISWTPNPVQVDTAKYAIVVSHGVATDTQYVDLFCQSSTNYKIVTKSHEQG